MERLGHLPRTLQISLPFSGVRFGAGAVGTDGAYVASAAEGREWAAA